MDTVTMKLATLSRADGTEFYAYLLEIMIRSYDKCLIIIHSFSKSLRF